MATHYYIPQTVFPVPIPAREYAELVARIPAGYVTTSKEIEMFLAHRHSAERVEYDGPLPKFYDHIRVISGGDKAPRQFGPD